MEALKNWTLLQLQKNVIGKHYRNFRLLGKSDEVAIGRTALELGLNRRDVEVIVMEENKYGV